MLRVIAKQSGSSFGLAFARRTGLGGTPFLLSDVQALPLCVATQKLCSWNESRCSTS